MGMTRTTQEAIEFIGYLKDILDAIRVEFPCDVDSHWLGYANDRLCMFIYVPEVSNYIKFYIESADQIRDPNLIAKDARKVATEYIEHMKKFEEAQKAKSHEPIESIAQLEENLGHQDCET